MHISVISSMGDYFAIGVGLRTAQRLLWPLTSPKIRREKLFYQIINFRLFFSGGMYIEQIVIV